MSNSIVRALRQTCTAALLAMLCAPAGATRAAPQRDAPTITWPDVPMVRGLATLPASDRPYRGADPWPEALDRSAAAWVGHWSAFARDLSDEARPSAADGDGAARKARLALCALHQERDGDGWEQLAALAARAPAEAARLVPHFVIGAPLELHVGAGLPEGVVLRPALPPPGADGLIFFEPIEVGGIEIGESRISMLLEVRGDGVDLRYRLDEGPHVSFAAVIPQPPGLAVRIEYYDWERADTVGEPLPVVLTEVGVWYRLWGPVQTARASWPTTLPNEVPRALSLAGLPLVIDENDREAPYVEGFAAACALLFPFEVHVRTSTSEPHGPLAHQIDLRASAERGEKWRDMTALLARFALAQKDRP